MTIRLSPASLAPMSDNAEPRGPVGTLRNSHMSDSICREVFRFSTPSSGVILHRIKSLITKSWVTVNQPNPGTMALQNIKCRYLPKSDYRASESRWILGMVNKRLHETMRPAVKAAGNPRNNHSKKNSGREQALRNPVHVPPTDNLVSLYASGETDLE